VVVFGDDIDEKKENWEVSYAGVVLPLTSAIVEDDKKVEGIRTGGMDFKEFVVVARSEELFGEWEMVD